MGDGFVVLQSNDVDIYYYQDEPGGVHLIDSIIQCTTEMVSKTFRLNEAVGAMTDCELCLPLSYVFGV